LIIYRMLRLYSFRFTLILINDSYLLFSTWVLQYIILFFGGIMELKKRAFGIALCLFWGLAILLGTWWMLIVGAQGQIFSKISVFYYGYSVSFIGGLVGFVWSFVFGFIGGVIFAWLYNLFVKKIYK